MIYGIGVDMVTVERLKKSIGRTAFAERVFSPAELDAFGSNAVKLAGCYAGKEAFAKVLGTGIRNFELSEVSVLRDNLGKPYYVFEGKAKQIVEDLGGRVQISITNEGGFAVAFAVMEISL